MHILFYDPLTPRPYTLETPSHQGLGGTEATILRIASALKTEHQITLAQHCRLPQEEINTEGLSYCSFETAHTLKPDVVILLRDYRRAEACALLFKKARLYLWLHNLPSKGLYTASPILLKHHIDLIAVSHFHKKAIKRRLRGAWYQRFLGTKRKPTIHVLYNPIDDELKPDSTPIKPQQLLFMSAPEKGLAQTLAYFTALRKKYPEYELLIANPGYSKQALQLPPGARSLGALSRPELLQVLRSSFCVFYPQTERQETFGLVYAEANAVGTPVLAHDFGAAREVLSDPCQLINGHHFSAVLKKLGEWREKRPPLEGQENFRLTLVKKSWLALLTRPSFS